MEYKVELEKLIGEMQTAFEKKLSVLEKYLATQQKAVRLKTNLEVRKAQALLDGQITGKNESLREAESRAILATEYAMLEGVSAEAEVLKLDLSLLSEQYDFLKEKSKILIALCHSV